jgi:cell division protein ZapA (FtsZ GTPase activity inhibitor)
MDDKLSIRVNVVDRYYPLKINREDEEKIRSAARMINEKVVQYKNRYSDKDTQDFLAMVSLQYVIKLLEYEKEQDVTPMIETVKELNEQLDDFITKEQQA